MGATADKVGFNTLESLYNTRFDPDKRIMTVVAVGRGGIPPTPVKAQYLKLIINKNNWL
ncbi:hypothetical protein K1Y38_01400 [Serratia marcescens]|nr:hypothetical protein [Serratia marcescens]